MHAHGALIHVNTDVRVDAVREEAAWTDTFKILKVVEAFSTGEV